MVGGQFGPLFLLILFLLVAWSPMERRWRREKIKKEIEKHLVGRLVGSWRSLVKEGGKPKDEERGKAGRRKEGWKERKDLTHRCVISPFFSLKIVHSLG